MPLNPKDAGQKCEVAKPTLSTIKKCVNYIVVLVLTVVQKKI